MSETFEKPKGFKKKLENIWYHYKIVILIVTFLVASGIYLGIDVLKKQDPDMVVAYVSETYGDETQFRRIEDAVYSIVGDINGDGRVRMNYRTIYMHAKKMSGYDIDVEQAYHFTFLDSQVRLFFIEDAYFEEKQGYFLPLEGILSPKSLENGLKNAEGEVCAVPLQGSQIAGKMHLDRPGLYLGVKRVISSERNNPLCEIQLEKAKEVAKYIMEGEA